MFLQISRILPVVISCIFLSFSSNLIFPSLVRAAGYLVILEPVYRNTTTGYYSVFSIVNISYSMGNYMIDFFEGSYEQGVFDDPVGSDGPFQLQPGEELSYDMSSDAPMGEDNFVGYVIISSDQPFDASINRPDIDQTLSAGRLHTCGINTDGNLNCWGYNTYNLATPPTGTFTQVSTGDFHNCGLMIDGTVNCWGWNSYDQVTVPDKSLKFSQVSAGHYHTCGLLSDGSIVCWGAGETDTEFPHHGQSIPPLGSFIEVSAGGRHTCGVRSDETVTCWGFNLYGQAIPPQGSFTQVSAGMSHTCGVRKDGTVACWGQDNYGQATPPTGTFIQVSAGKGAFSCGVKTDGTIVCWGRNDDGQTSSPSGLFKQVSSGGYHSCGMQTEGNVLCWGDNSYDQASLCNPMARCNKALPWLMLLSE